MMNNKEYAYYTKEYGKNAYELLDSLIKTSGYNDLTDNQKQKAIENIYSYAKEKNKTDYANENNIKIDKNSSLYNTVEELNKKGGNVGQYFKYLAQTDGMEKESEKNKALLNSSCDNKTKELIYTNGTGKDDETYKKISKDININTYLDYKNKMSEETIKQRNNGQIKEKGQLKDKDKIDLLLNSKYSNKEKTTLYENTIKSAIKDGDVDMFDLLKKTNIDINEYLNYLKQDLKADKEDDGTLSGKSVSNSKKDKVYDYINNNISNYNSKLLLLGSQYKLNSNERYEIYELINSMKGLSQEDKLKYFNKMQGFTSYKNGTVKF